MNSELEKLIKVHYQKKFSNQEFIPGKTRIPASGKVFNEQEMIKMVDAVLDGWWTEGVYAAGFEEKFAQYIGVKHCITTNSGSSANLLALSTLRSWRLDKRALKPGDEVITIAANFPTTINPIIINRFLPVFIDVDLETLNPEFNKIKSAVTPKTKAIFIPSNIGNVPNWEELSNFCKEKNIWLVEDNCDALGSIYNGKKVGNFGDLSTFSFYAGHHLAMGEGGAVLTNDDNLARAVRSIRDWGRDCWCKTGHDNTCNKRFSWQLGDLPAGYDHKFIFSDFGYNLRITDIQAALGLVQLEKIDSFNQIRRDNFKFLSENFKPWDKYFVLPKPQPNSDPSWFGFYLTLKPSCPFSRQDIINYLEKKQIATRLILAGNIIKQPYFKNYHLDYRISGDLTNTDIIMNNSFWVGLYHGVTRPMLEFIIQSFNEFISKYA